MEITDNKATPLLVGWLLYVKTAQLAKHAAEIVFTQRDIAPVWHAWLCIDLWYRFQEKSMEMLLRYAINMNDYIVWILGVAYDVMFDLNS